MQRVHYGIDDWLILAALSSEYVFLAFIVYAGHNGLGKHDWIVPLDDIERVSHVGRPTPLPVLYPPAKTNWAANEALSSTSSSTSSLSSSPSSPSSFSTDASSACPRSSTSASS
ncbi:hypothetical protein BDW74DRAFT_147545 [Aspergillus multicolor]|uniref:uncharacterized protein n=1 Tax=Aspergillus multicolor TaxID=41759 RepID=UPI003CCE012C